MNKISYMERANVTMSDDYHEGVTKKLVADTLRFAIREGEVLDAIKKYQFYGRELPKELSVALSTYAHDEIDFSKLTADGDVERARRIYHAIMGTITEAVELGQALLKSLEDDVPLDEVNLFEEAGDSKWYNSALVRALGKTDEECEDANIAKLQGTEEKPGRFKGKFDAFYAQQENRDLVRERESLESSMNKA